MSNLYKGKNFWKKGCYLHSVQHSYERLSLHSRSFESYKVDLQNFYS